MARAILARRCLALFLTIALSSAAGGLAQVAPCPEGKVALTDELDRIVAEAKKAVIESRDAQLASPSSRTDETQVAAPSSSSSSTSLVNAAAFPSFLGFALESGLVQSSEGAVTVDLNPFAAVALFRPQARFLQSEYQKHENLRRFGGSLTLGGKGEKFDRDGDGEADDPLEAKDVTDIVDWELRVRLSRSRDRRDRTNYVPILEATEAADLAFSAARSELELAAGLARQRLGLDHDGCVDRVAFAAFSQEPAIQSAAGKVNSAQVEAAQAFEDAVAVTDNRPLWTLVIGGVDRGEQYGPDSVKAALRGAIRDHSFNLEWSEKDGLQGAEDPEMFKLAYEYSTQWLKSKRFPEGIKASASAAYEKFEHVPDALHDDVVKASLKLEFPFSEGMSLPLSITYANHKDLLEEEDEIRGHIGISYDFSKLLKPKSD